MSSQSIESTALIKFLDERILLAEGSGKTEKIKMLKRCRELATGYYENQPGFHSAQSKPEPDLFGESDVEPDLFG